MKVIVEAGSTKTDSVLLDEEHKVIQRHTSSGINPLSDKQYLDAVKQLINLYSEVSLEEIYFYGSGCINDEVNQQVATDMQQLIGKPVPILVADDLIAVGRGMCQKNVGIVGILGTGSNMGYYNGEKITDGVQSCGYLIGDEGSGYQIGSAIYRRLARKQFTSYTSQKIIERFHLNNEDPIAYLYRHPNPRAFLASISKSFNDLDPEDKMVIIDEVFDRFLEHMVFPIYKKYKTPVHLSGSIAVYFSQELKYKFQKFDIIAADFVRSPLEGLIRYHTYE